MRPKLTLVAGKADKAEIRLKLPTIVGRTRDAGLMIAHKTVSRRHCELFERHGMLFVRDTGSRNGTLVDNVPIKEAMLKPGHTLTVGPLTFRADYEPADSFIRADEPDGTVAGKGVAASATAEVAATTVAPAKPSDTPVAGELEFEEVGIDDGDGIDLPPVPESSDEAGTELPVAEAAEPAGEVADAEPALDAELALDDDLDLSLAFDESAEAAGDDVAAVVEDAPAEPAAAQSAKSDDPLGELEPADEILSFELADEPAESAKAEEPAAASLDDGALGFELEDPKLSGDSSEGAADELGFTLEDLEEPPVMPEPASEANGEDIEFEVAEPEPEPAPAPAKKGKPAPEAAKVKLGEEPTSGGESDMSRFMKELGL
jgi:predicted component of type VI protein secretion system